MNHHPPPSEGINRLVRAVTQKVFRGQIYEDDADNPEVKDFIACHFHRKIMRDALKPTTRRIGIRAANQVGKTTIMELIFKFLMKYFPADMLMWDMNEAKANDHMKNRYMPILRADPVLGPLFRKIAASPETRWNVCTTNILLPGMVFRARPLNEQWVQSFPAKYGGLSDAALVEAALVRKIEVRFTKYESSYLWVVESQGDAPMGILGGGMAEFMAKTNEMKLHVRCPECQARVRFLFHHLRNEDTKIVAPTSVPTLEREAWIAHHRPILRSEERKHCGFKVLGELKNDDGSINERDIMKSTVYECPACGENWVDDNIYHSGEKATYGPTRIYLDREAGLDENWIATRPTALPGFLGYTIPRWINPKPSWGAVMLTFKQAMAAKKMGNLMPLQEFKTKWEGEDWDEKLEAGNVVAAITGTYDPNVKQIPNESFRSLQGDCQKDIIESVKQGKEVTGHLWVIVDAVDKGGGTFQLFRGYVHSWDELNAVRIKFGVPTRNVAIDGKHWFDTVKEMAAKYRTLEDRRADGSTEAGKKFLATWKVMTGDVARGFKHVEDNSWRIYSPVKNEHVNILQPDQTWLRVSVPVYRWSNFSVTNQLKMLQRGEAGKPKFIALDVSQLACKTPKEIVQTQFGPVDIAPIYARTRAKEIGEFTYESQMNGQLLGEERGKAKWIDLHKQQHYSDDSKMGIVLKALKGLIGHIAAEDEAAQPT